MERNSIDPQLIMTAIHEAYGLRVTNLEFILRGFGGDCYRAVSRSGNHYFLKLHDPVSNQMTAASSRAFYLPLMHQLTANDILPEIPHLRQTLDGGLSLKIGLKELVITNFIEGELVGFGRLPQPILVRLAEMVGILHNSKSKVDFESPFIEGFEVVFESDLLESFDLIANLPGSTTVGQSALQEIILPRKEQILKDLERLKALQGYARKGGKPKVICHTDLHGGNMMTDRDGRLYILDWENAMIAPPEHDMFFFVGEGDFWELFWPHYTRCFPSASIDPDLLRFYFYRRALEDVADFIFRILRAENNPERDQQEIEWMVNCLDGMPQIEGTVAAIQERLEA